MLISYFRDQLFDLGRCKDAGGSILEIKNSDRDGELKKVFVDCSGLENVLLINAEPKRGASICTLFQRSGHHMKTCDGIVLVEREDAVHAIFCELKTSWDPSSIQQIRNTKLVYDYADAVAHEWHVKVRKPFRPWFAVLCKNGFPTKKFSTSFKLPSIPTSHKPSNDPRDPRRIHLIDKRGQFPERPIRIEEMANIA